MDFLDLSLTQSLYCFLGIAAGGFLRGFLGFGAALLIVPVLSFVVSPVEAIAILVLIEIPNIVYLTPQGLRGCDFKAITPMLVGVLVAVPIGTKILVSVDQKEMKLIMSAVILMAIGLLLSGWRIRGPVNRLTMLVAGIIGGGLQGTSGMGGPPLVTTILSLRDDESRTRANIITMLNTMSTLNAMTLAAYGKITADLVQFSVVAAVIYVASTMFGAKFFRHGGNLYFRQVALLILAAIALVMIWSALK